MINVDTKLENWKKKLLDLGKRNRLINYKETKRSNLNIIAPQFDILFQKVVSDEEALTFPYPLDRIYTEEDVEEIQVEVVDGDIETDRTIKEQQRTLKSLRDKAKTAMEEQGVNILYLSFGFLNWYESANSSQTMVSPIVLVPVTLSIESISDPYKLSIHEDEIVVNPTLIYKMDNDFGIKLPEFDAQAENIISYLESVAALVKRSGWTVDRKVSLSLLSFLKINMYYDLNNHSEAIKNHSLVKALCGDYSEVENVPENLNNYDHDSSDRPMDVYQVVDADSSQQDAVILSKKSVSFVLQGPPGTGKSQTITNIISEALADGKKVLFVSEKMAALEVVHRRLSNAGLSDFCLILHSHKANKKEILKSLGDTLNLDRVSVREDALYQLEVLKSEREKLNDYCVQLHQPCPPLGKSIFEVNGILAKLCYAPDVLFDFDSVEQTTPEQWRHYLYLLSEFANTIGKMSEDYETNSWKGCTAEQVSHQLRQDIESNLKILLPQISELATRSNETFSVLCLESQLTFNSLSAYARLFDFTSKAPFIPGEWLESDNLDGLIQQANNLYVLKNEYSDLRDYLCDKYDATFFALEAQKAEAILSINIQKLQQLLDVEKYCDEKKLYESIDSLRELCQNFKSTIEKLCSCTGTICKELYLTPPNAISEMSNLLNLMQSFSRHILATESWFIAEKNSTRFNLLQKAKDMHESMEMIRADVFKLYEKEIVNIDYADMLKRFKTEYTSFLKIFKSIYRSDCNEIRGLRINPVKKIADKEILDLLCKLKLLDEKATWFRDNNDELKEMLGGLFKGEHSDYVNILEAMDAFKTISIHFNGNIPEKVKQHLINGTNSAVCLNDIPVLTSLLTEASLIQYFECLSTASENNYNCGVEQHISICNEIVAALTNYECTMKTIIAGSTQKQDFNAHKENIYKLARVQEIEKEIEVQNEALKQQYHFLYSGIQTDWEQVSSALLWTVKFVDYIDTFQLSREFQEKVLSHQVAKTLEEVGNYLNDVYQKIASSLQWFDGLFDDAHHIDAMSLFSLQDKMERCLKNIAGLEEWIDFRNARKNCEAAGLAEFIEAVLGQRLDKSLIKDAFSKRFYRLWLDAILPNYPAVYSFRSRNQEETVRRFTMLDKAQMEIARLRIRERLIDALPDVNRITSAVDEVGILKRELAKQKKIMPIRKLFVRIPTLLPSLKPCLMMSPLSVSLFLQSDSYNFDMVIFDEASQVCTENAIGAIMRAKQVIIAGDSKQLPPTNFFNASISDGDFDVDNEEDDSVAYESVLDEAVTVLPERSLKWHYRSRHEHLIAFSNAKIYNQSLITFPSNVDRVPNNGVEYVFVENGIYDRSGKRNNVNEAKKVADLVFEHIATQSHRSLGVITFSEAQQQAVDAAIRQLRIQTPQYEEYFSEEKDESFFIKNLENVQGDERDTIIFSIGYAKDAHGMMYMNFGPLSRDGGYRRLNVAITRAKYNVKLVGSIHPTDIKLENTNVEGVKMLRAYIEFAMNGPRILENELRYDKFVNVESPFEEAVYDFLVSKGFRIATQVGCSGYRIDMAVKHPDLDGRFVLGIECDGATYHSSRTARERDRLRQSVLEDIGWHIYRIWSTDWIKDPIKEGGKLVEAVNRSIDEYTEETVYAPVTCEEKFETITADQKYLVIDHFDKPNEDVHKSSGFGFSKYRESDIFSLPHVDYGIKDVCAAIEYVVALEFPIHFELLCKRIAPLFGNQKATVKIRNQVEYALSKMNGKVTRKNDFVYPADDTIIIPKTPAEGEIPRPVNYISPTEIGEAMLVIIAQSYGITKESLFQVTAREYGFNRTGTNIVTVFDNAFAALKKGNRITIIENRLSLTKE